MRTPIIALALATFVALVVPAIAAALNNVARVENGDMTTALILYGSNARAREPGHDAIPEAW